jgi:hypothetical protein
MVLLEKRLKRNNKELEVKKIIGENFSNQINKIEDRQKLIFRRQSKMKNFNDEKKMESFFLSQEKSRMYKMKKDIYEKQFENKIENKKKVNIYLPYNKNYKEIGA